MPISPRDYDRYLPRLTDSSGKMMRAFLRRRNLKLGDSGTNQDQAEQFLEHVKAGNLNIGDVRLFLLDFRESNSKRVRIYDYVARPGHEGLLQTAIGNAVSDRSTIDLVYGKQTRLAYTSHDSGEVRMVYTETQTYAKPLVKQLAYDVKQISKTIVVRYSPAHHRLTIAFDKPENDHGHGDRVEDYYSAFEAKTESSFGLDLTAKNLSPFLLKIADGLLETVNKLLVDDGEIRDTMVRGGLHDVRKSKKYKAAKDNLRLGGDFVWKAGISTTNIGSFELTRLLTAKVQVADGSVSFLAHTSGEEIDYVISQILNA